MELGIDVGRNYTKGVSSNKQECLVSLISSVGETNLEGDRLTITIGNKTFSIGEYYDTAYTFKKDNYDTVKDLLITMAALLGGNNIITGIAIADYRNCQC